MACAIIHAWVQPLRSGVDAHNQWAVGHDSTRGGTNIFRYE
jgi:hypothetical protein